TNNKQVRSINRFDFSTSECPCFAITNWGSPLPLQLVLCILVPIPRYLATIFEMEIVQKRSWLTIRCPVFHFNIPKKARHCVLAKFVAEFCSRSYLLASRLLLTRLLRLKNAAREGCIMVSEIGSRPEA